MEEANKSVDLGQKKKSKQNSLNVGKLNTLNHQELVEKIRQLEAQNNQLQNILRKKNEEETVIYSSPNKPGRKFIFEGCAKRHVLLKLYYLGWDYHGFVTQIDTFNTVEYHLFGALKKSCLIEERSTSNYQRCGRTDKGVSAFSQVISIDLRSQLENPTADNCDSELPYVTILNKILPKNIRCYAWAHVDSNISARFDCTSRTYQFYFPKGVLDISLMKEGAKHLLGEHDFRNFCKMDVKNGVVEFTRKIIDVDIKPCSSDSHGSDYEMYKFVIQGSGFLWHQIRCIMSVLILIGQGKESPDIVQQLLDVSKNPKKPQYLMASDLPLTLFANNFGNIDTRWNVDDNDVTHTVRLLQKQWTEYSIRATMIKDMEEEISKLSQEPLNVQCHVDRLFVGKLPKIHRPLLSRQTGVSLEEKIDNYMKKRRLVKSTNDENET